MTVNNGTSIKSIKINENNELILTLNDDTVLSSDIIETGTISVKEL